ncbi:hypothetical protein [Extensimonas vulgaris]|uniref:Predicted 3'-5' exonuclease PolB-like domain-containing protein n=1 Tax=Extensimonas vulgaris TaxID=1031594 RepID=A0A369AKV1_9BURK|nr:hypothetical protein [Extensimonas vulgaris]RCX09801.1 hypothetical protein DFR45_104169 [Extensimonas vulgaris]TWI39431.1 hypothetical protein IP95_01336 [Extensimonas vulgaris]TXD15673.1 hypothetical protein FUT63_07075 [Extensimonas vulgaris]
MTILHIDLETVPSQHPDAREQARQSVRPPGTLKREDSIATWWAESGPAAVEDAYRRQALDPAAGEVCCVGFALDDADAVAVVRTLEESERDFLLRALKAINALLEARRPDPSDPAAPWFDGVRPHLVGHNIGGFDLPFLRARLWVSRIKLPGWMPGPLARVGRDYGDTMVLFAGLRDKISLDRLCRALGVASPKADGTTGAAVLDLWLAGRHTEIAEYCARDVQAVRSAWRVMTGEGCEPWAA